MTPTRPIRLSDRVIRHSPEIAGTTDVLDAERWASGWLGDAWYEAPIGDRDAEHMLCVEVVGRACTKPSPQGLAAVAALRRVASPGEHKLLDETIDILTADQPTPPWLHAPTFEPQRAWQAVDVWDSERVHFIEYVSSDEAATAHTLMAQTFEVGCTMVENSAFCEAAPRTPGNPCATPTRCRCPSRRYRSPTRWPTSPDA